MPKTAHAQSFSSHRRPVPRQDDVSDARRNWVVAALSVGAFGIGVTEFVAMGLLPYIASQVVGGLLAGGVLFLIASGKADAVYANPFDAASMIRETGFIVRVT